MLKINIQLFAEGGGETGAETGGKAAAFDVDAELHKRFPDVPEFAAPKNKAETQKKAQEPDAGNGQAASAEAEKQDGKEAAPSPEQEDAELRGLLKGRLKNAGQRWSQGMLDERFKNHNAKVAQLEQQLEAFKNAYAGYAQKLGVDPNDPEAIEKAVLADGRNFREMAMELGVSTEEAARQFQEKQKADAQKAAQDKAQQQMVDQQLEQEAFRQRQEKFAGWLAEENEIRKADPSFDLSTDYAQNEEFRKALDAGMSVRFAYNATHFDQRMAAVAGAVEQQTAINVSKQIAAGQNRPTEGGLHGNPGIRTATSYADLSDAEFLKVFKKMGF